MTNTTQAGPSATWGNTPRGQRAPVALAVKSLDTGFTSFLALGVSARCLAWRVHGEDHLDLLVFPFMGRKMLQVGLDSSLHVAIGGLPQPLCADFVLCAVPTDGTAEEGLQLCGVDPRAHSPLLTAWEEGENEQLRDFSGKWASPTGPVHFLCEV